MIRHIIHILLAVLLLWGCQPEFEVFAPEKDLYAVYGILHPDSSRQYIKVSRVFQYEGDSHLYVSENDLTVKGLNITLTGNGQVLEAVQIDSVPKDPGLFVSSQTIYRLETSGNESLIPGKRYDLLITRPDDPDFQIRSHTTIPQKPLMKSPGEPIMLPGEQSTLPMVEFSEGTAVQFYAGNAMGFEVQVKLKYREGGEERSLKWGPSPVFLGDKGCGGNKFKNEHCFEIPDKAVVRLLKNVVDQATGPISIQDQPQIAVDPGDLPRFCYVEVTAIDSGLTEFLATENPFGFGLNLLMDRPSFSNISGDNTGIFGSINTDGNFVFVGGCTKYLSGLSDPITPPTNCEW